MAKGNTSTPILHRESGIPKHPYESHKSLARKWQSRFERCNALFERFLTLSGLTKLFRYFVTYVLDPICSPLLDALIKRADPRQEQRAHIIRAVAKPFQLDIYPQIFAECEECVDCGLLKFLLVQPAHHCWECWRDDLAHSHGLWIVEKNLVVH